VLPANRDADAVAQPDPTRDVCVGRHSGTVLHMRRLNPRHAIIASALPDIADCAYERTRRLPMTRAVRQPYGVWCVRMRFRRLESCLRHVPIHRRRIAVPGAQRLLLP
jgi:hypothetical protein